MTGRHPRRGPDRGRRPANGVLRRDGQRLAARASVGLLVGAVAATVSLVLDAWLPLELPVALSNVQVLLSTLGGALITVVVFALWMRTVVVGLLSDQLSPRVVTGYLDDAFQRRIVTVGVAAVTYLIVVVLALPDPEGPAVPPPAISTVVSAMLALAGIVGLLLAVHAAVVSLSQPDVIRTLADHALDLLDRPLPADDEPPADRPGDDVDQVVGDTLGWVTAIDREALFDALPPGATLSLDADVGEFVTDRQIVARADDELSDDAAEAVRRAITVSRTRSAEHDLAYAIQPLIDIAEHAMQPASNDTSTAHEALLHLRAVLDDVVHRGAATGWLGDEHDRWVRSERTHRPAHHLVLALDRLREGAAHSAPTTRELLSVIDHLRTTAQVVGDDDSQEVLDQQRVLLERAVEASDEPR